MMLFFVRYQTFEAPCHTCSDEEPPAQTWIAAKARRNAMFADGNFRRCWIERIDRRMQDGLTIELSKVRCGFVLERREPELSALPSP